MADSVETLGVDLRTRVKRLGVKGKTRRKKCKVRFSLIKNNKVFQKELHEGGGQEVVTSGYGASKDVGQTWAALKCLESRTAIDRWLRVVSSW